MYMGKIVEVGPAETICTAPGHPYTAGLIAAVPAVTGDVPQSAGAGRQVAPGWSGGLDIGGEPPAGTRPPSGCRFRTRCALAQEVCAEQEPLLQPHIAAGQVVACHFPLMPAGYAQRAEDARSPAVQPPGSHRSVSDELAAG
jgi:peptide/nickel transport system ATP-binding protein